MQRDKMSRRQAMPVIRDPGLIESLATLPGTAPAVTTGATMRELIELEHADVVTEYNYTNAPIGHREVTEVADVRTPDAYLRCSCGLLVGDSQQLEQHHAQVSRQMTSAAGCGQGWTMASSDRPRTASLCAREVELRCPRCNAAQRAPYKADHIEQYSWTHSELVAAGQENEGHRPCESCRAPLIIDSEARMRFNEQR